MRKFLLSCLLSGFCLSLVVQGQKPVSEDSLTISFNNISVVEALHRLDDISDKTIFFSDNIFKNNSERISGSFRQSTLADILSKILSDQYQYKVEENSITILAIRKYSLSGMVIDSANGMPLPYATIFVQSGAYTTTNEHGQYSISLPQGSHSVAVSYVGFVPQHEYVTLNKNTSLTIGLRTDLKLPEVIVTDTEKLINSNEEQFQMSQSQLMHLTKTSPNLGSNQDLLHISKVIPGVQSGSGGVGGIFIRGGNASQNLMLVDGLQVYNPHHSLGLTSIFSPLVARSFQIFKSGFMPQDGDRSASVFDVKLKDGNLYQRNTIAEINPQDATIAWSSPIVGEKLSLFAYGRTSTWSKQYKDIISQALQIEDVDDYTSGYQEMVVKTKWQLSQQSKLSAFYFITRDKMKLENLNAQMHKFQSDFHWNNKLLGLKWTTQVHPNVFLNVRSGYNNYQSSLAFLVKMDNVNLDFSERGSLIDNYSLHIAADVLPHNGMRIKFGTSVDVRQYQNEYVDLNDGNIGEISEVSDSLFMFGDLDDLTALTRKELFESVKFAQFFSLSKTFVRSRLNIGLRNTIFMSGAKIFIHPQPRFNYEYHINDRLSAALDISNTIQYEHNLSLSGLSLPGEIWFPVHDDLKPEVAWHYNASLTYYNLARWLIKTQLYYKDSNNQLLLDFENSPNSFRLQGQPVIQGRHRAYGVELSCEYNKERFDFLLAYALSKSEIIIGEIVTPSQFNRRHEVKFTGSYRLGDHFYLGINQYFDSGHPKLIVFPFTDTFSFLSDINLNEEYSKPAYRIDLSLSYELQLSQVTHLVKLNFYNSTNSTLPLHYSRDQTTQEITPNFSIPFLPTLNYTVRF